MANNKNPLHRKRKESISLSPAADEFIDEVAEHLVSRGLAPKPIRSRAADICIRYAKFAASQGVDILDVLNVSM